MGGYTSSTDSFEEVLERGRKALAAARDEYEALEKTETVPSGLVEAISDLEQELDEADRVLNVDEADLELAQQTVQRIELLEAVLSALRERQRTVVEADVSRIDHHLSGLATLIREQGFGEEIEGKLEEIEKKQRMLTTLTAKDRHEKILTNDRVSPETIDKQLKQLRADIEPDVPADPRVEAYTAITEDLLEEIHDALGSLGAENEDRTAYAAELKSIKQRLRMIESGERGGSRIDTAESTLEETLSLHGSIARSQADQRVTEELADAISESGLAIECDVQRCVAEGDSETLLSAVSDGMGTEVRRSTVERLRQLLKEHDGSVLRTAQATDFDVPAILEHLEHLYDDGQIAEMEVRFD